MLPSSATTTQPLLRCEEIVMANALTSSSVVFFIFFFFGWCYYLNLVDSSSFESYTKQALPNHTASLRKTLRSTVVEFCSQSIPKLGANSQVSKHLLIHVCSAPFCYSELSPVARYDDVRDGGFPKGRKPHTCQCFHFAFQRIGYALLPRDEQ